MFDNFQELKDLIEKLEISQIEKDKILDSISKFYEKFSLIESKQKRLLRDKIILTSLLSKTSHELQDSIETEKGFLASVSHEIRTPLNSIIGFIELLQNTDINENQCSFIENIGISSQHLLALINDILDISKIEAKQFELIEEEIDLEELLNECVIIISSRVKNGVELNVSIPELGFYVISDPVRLKQIFINLLGNSAKFTDNGYIKVSLLDLKEIDDELNISICVEDSGIGIPKYKQKELFKPFKQAHKNSSEAGTGLGLYLSKSIANMMRGDIYFKSEESIGTKFFINLVLKKGNFKDFKFRFDNKNILLIQDDKILKKQIQNKFTYLGANVLIPEEFSKGVELYKYCLKINKLDFVIFDSDKLRTKIRYISSFIKELFPDILVITINHSEKEFNSGEVDIIIKKPFSFYKISSLINEYLTKKISISNKNKKDFKDIKVLLVEDVEMNVLLVKEMFKTFFNATLDIAYDGLEAIEKIKNNSYQLVFMDIQMPKMNGFEATKIIRNFNNSIPIVAMSANVFNEDIEKAKEVGMDDYIKKPIKKYDIENALKNIKLHDISNSYIKKPQKNKGYRSEEKNRTEEKRDDHKKRIIEHFETQFRDDKISEELFKIAIENIKEVMFNIEVSIKTDEKAGIRRGFHSLKGIMLNLGLNKEAKIASELENLSIMEGKEREIELKKNILFSFLNNLGSKE